MGFIREFKDFAFRGNVLDLAIGVIIGGAAGRIVTALVDNILMPVINMIAGGQAPLKEIKIGSIEAGAFLQAVLDFIIIAIVLFLIIRFVNRLKKAMPAAPAEPVVPPAPSRTEELLSEILQTLKK